jgi:3-isopropylmalate/(R)-2-methylmalate dehydratase small subunit
MTGFKTVISLAVPLLRINVDTDTIIPSREMKQISKKGLSDGLFAGWRYLNEKNRILDPDFVLNDSRYQGSQILLSGDNFGCGSSREHAVWALHEYGFRVIIAPSFGSIFYKNCIRNGILPIRLQKNQIDKLVDNTITIELKSQKIDKNIDFDIAPADKNMLLLGLDDIDINLSYSNKIEEFEKSDRKRRPWAYLT